MAAPEDLVWVVSVLYVQKSLVVCVRSPVSLAPPIWLLQHVCRFTKVAVITKRIVCLEMLIVPIATEHIVIETIAKATADRYVLAVALVCPARDVMV